MNRGAHHVYTNEFQLRNSASDFLPSPFYKPEKLFYIIRSDGTSLFELPYREEFVYHCLIKLLDVTPKERYSLLEYVPTSFTFNFTPILSKEHLLKLF